MFGDFTETELKTKFGDYSFRVYKDEHGCETIVIYSGNLDTNEPTLVRVHSECITSEMFGSLHCDCGDQLHESLNLIQKNGGVVIYLRQEGRGIGLFEKIKAYKLQKKGYDTVEANLALGHSPDKRTYEMVKIALDDLHIDKIFLLTNNPSKVSEIAKLGIKVEKRLPLDIKTNEVNKNYFETKTKKFQHSFSKKELCPYFYQFKVNSAEQIFEIQSFIESKNKDPLLKFCVGLNMDFETFNNQHEMSNIRKIINACVKSQYFEPIIHFTFLCSSDHINNLKKLKAAFPNIKRVQLNDLDQMEMDFLQEAQNLFQIDLPLSDENMDLINNCEFQQFVKENDILLALDNSKGEGIQEDKIKLKEKIDLLIDKGLNHISLHGGFGPDTLENYFSLRRYYKFNLSIDAESKLKTNGRFDTEKIKRYLNHLIRFDDPKDEAIKQTKSFLTKNRRKAWQSTCINGVEFQIHPEVFHPGHFPSSKWFADNLNKKLKGKFNFCEVGCGSGAISCLLALKNPLGSIVATDINPHATKNTSLNAKSLHLEKKIQVYNGDVFDGLDKNLEFDFIFWALPFGYLDPGEKLSNEDLQVFDSGYRATRKFFQTAKSFLKPGGELLLGFSTELGNSNLLYEIADEFNFKLKKNMDAVLSETADVKFELLSGTHTHQLENIQVI